MSFLTLNMIVFVGAFAQSATGVGFGVVAGPLLLHAFGYDRGIAETAVFSLLVAVVSALRQFSWAQPRATAMLTATLPAGVIPCLVLLTVAPRAAIVIAFGIMLCGLGTILLFQRHAALADDHTAKRQFQLSFAVIASGVLAGAGAALFAAPGPAAAWGLAHARLSAERIRGTLAVYFVIAYVTIIIGFWFLGSMATVEWKQLAYLCPACIVGSVVGVVLGDRVSTGWLRRAIALIVIASGLSILWPLIQH